MFDTLSDASYAILPPSRAAYGAGAALASEKIAHRADSVSPRPMYP
jgi:hypothetical protein